VPLPSGASSCAPGRHCSAFTEPTRARRGRDRAAAATVRDAPGQPSSRTTIPKTRERRGTGRYISLRQKGSDVRSRRLRESVNSSPTGAIRWTIADTFHSDQGALQGSVSLGLSQWNDGADCLIQLQCLLPVVVELLEAGVGSLERLGGFLGNWGDYKLLREIISDLSDFPLAVSVPDPGPLPGLSRRCGFGVWWVSWYTPGLPPWG
jgi:hypothetical protein